MADILKPAFRATSGLDAAGEKVINVAKADYDVLDDGVNVEFFIEENTIQQYDETRGYENGFAVIHDNRIWTATRDIAKPAGPFVELYWKAVRTDPKWLTVNSPTHQIKSGEYIAVDSSNGPTAFTLPAYPNDGDTVVIKDIGGQTGYNEVKVSISNHLMFRNGNNVASTLISQPYAYSILIFANQVWNFWQAANEERGIRVEPGMGEFRTSAGDFIMRRYTTAAPVTLILPKYANHGDIVKSTDIDGMGPSYHLIVKTFDTTSSIGQSGTHQMEFRTKGDGFLVYNEPDKTWVVWDGDIRTRLQIVRDDIVLLPNQSISVLGKNNNIPQTINITLPTDVAVGDIVKIALNYLRKQQTVNIKIAPGSGDKIATNINLLQFPKRSEYPPDADWVKVDDLTFNGDISYTPVIEFSYVEEDGVSYWLVAQNVPTVERVDPLNDNTRKRLGVIALASQLEANADHENNPLKEQAITPETLANRVSTELRRGIARIAKTEHVNQDSNFEFADDLIISPKKLNERTATETRRGLAEIATQEETNLGTDDKTIVTPKKLNDRKATEDLSGIAKLVISPGVAGTARGVAGQNIYDFAEHTRIVTPKTLFEMKATAAAQGGVYLAIQSEVDTGKTNVGYGNSVVTPETLHARKATDTNHGLIEIATQAETDLGTDYTRAVTPKTLNDRNATQTLTGIARIATETEFNEGLLDNVISTPLKVQKHFNTTSRTSVNDDSGLIESGTLWDHYTLDIREAKEDKRGTLKLSTQLQADAGLDDTTAITPLKLMKKKATEEVEGIIQIATQAETVAGTVINKAVSPKHLKYVIQNETSWEATPARRGAVRLTTGAATWTGDDVNGSKDHLATFESNGYAISPLQMNTALTHYLPIKATAVNSELLDNLDSTQFIRRDVDQTVEGSLTLTKATQVQADITSTASATFGGNVTAEALYSRSLVNIKTGTNNWNLKAPTGNEFIISGITTGTETPVLTLVRQGGLVRVHNDLTVMKNLNVDGTISLASKKIVSSTGTTLEVGDVAQDLKLNVKDASNIIASDGGDYKVITEKNVKTVVDRDFVKKTGDNMSGKLTVEAPVLARITEAEAVADTLTDDFTGMWTAEITTPAVYAALPGYAVPTFATHPETGQEYVDKYDYVKAPGLMTCTGVSPTYIYRTWIPHPESVQLNHTANSQWISVWDVARNVWGEWGRVFTTQAPPTAADVGAVSTSGAQFANLTIKDWLQIGNVRIMPDPVTRTVKFDWIDNP